MPNEFLQQFMAGWQMGQGRLESRRRDQELQMQQQLQQQRMQQEELDRQLRMEHLKIQQQELKTARQKLEFEGKAQQAAMLSKQQEILPPQTEDLGGATPEAPSAGVLNMGPMVQERAPIMAQIPGTEGPQVPMPFREDIEAEQQRKNREALGMLDLQEAIKAQYREKPKTLQEIEAESAARARGTARGTPAGTGIGPDTSLEAVAGGLANYEIGLSDLGRMPQGAKAAVFAAAKKINPSFNASLYSSRQKLRADFTSGKTANNIDSLNTAVDHLNTLAEYTKALNNGNMPFANSIAQNFATATGSPQATNYKTMATAVESEVASLLKKTGATDQEISSWRANFSATGSPAQLEGSIKTVLKVMRGREQALQQRWKTGMGTGEGYPIYGDEQRAILDALGYSGGEKASDGGGWETVAGVRVRRKAR